MGSFEEDMFLGRFATSQFTELSTTTKFVTDGPTTIADPDQLHESSSSHSLKPLRPMTYRTVYKLDQDPSNWTIQERVAVDQLLKMDIPKGQGKALARSLLPLHEHNSVLEVVNKYKSEGLKSVDDLIEVV